MDNTSRIAWLSSIGALKRGNLRIHPAAEALTPSVVADLDAAMKLDPVCDDDFPVWFHLAHLSSQACVLEACKV